MYDTQTARQLVNERLAGARRNATDRRRTRRTSDRGAVSTRSRMTWSTWVRRERRPVAAPAPKPTIA